MTDTAPAAVPNPTASRLIERAKAHYHGQDRIKIEVPEWDAVIYSRPMTFEDSAHAMRIRGDDPKRWYASVIVTMAEDESGKKLFAFTDVDSLVSEVESRIVIGIGLQITGDRVTVEEHEGN